MNNRGEHLFFISFFLIFVFFDIFHHGNIHNSGLGGPINLKFSPFIYRN